MTVLVRPSKQETSWPLRKLQSKGKISRQILESLLRQISHQSHSSNSQWLFHHQPAMDKLPVSHSTFLSFPFFYLLSHPRMILSMSSWYFSFIQVNCVCLQGQRKELDPGASSTHLPRPLSQVLNTLCPGCFWLHTDTAPHLLSEHCGSLNSPSQEQQCEHSPGRGRRDRGEGFTYILSTNSTKCPLAKVGFACIKMICAALQPKNLGTVLPAQHCYNILAHAYFCRPVNYSFHRAINLSQATP